MQTLKSTGLCLDVRAAPGNVFLDVSMYHHAITNNNVVTVKGMGDALGGKFNGTDAYLDIGNINNTVNTVEIWLKPASITVTEEILDLNGAAYIKATSGTITAEGFNAPIIYINGIVAPIISTNWNHVVATTTTSINATDVDIGRLEASTWFDGIIFISRIYNRALPAYEILNNYYEYATLLGLG